MGRFRAWVIMGVVLIVVGACGGGSAEVARPSESTGPVETSVPANADPQLAALYRDVVQKDMPGVPFSILDGAKKEGKVVFYHLAFTAATTPAIAEFKKRFPFIAVDEFTATGGPLMERFLAEKRAGSDLADVIETGSEALMTQLIDEGHIEKYKATSEGAFKPGTFRSGWWYAVAVGANIVYIYNTNLVTAEQAKILERFDGLWDPALAGKTIGVPNVVSSPAAQQFFYYLEKAYGAASWEKLKSFKVLDPLPGGDAVARGEVAIMPDPESVGQTQWGNKAPVRWTVPQPALVDPYPQAIASKAPHPNAARLLQEFLLSKPGQTPFATFVSPSARTDVPESRAVASESWFVPSDRRTYFDEDRADFAKRLPSLIEDWKKVFKR